MRSFSFFKTKITFFMIAVILVCTAQTWAGLSFIHVSKDGRHFACADSNSRFLVWGFNYDHDFSGRLLEEYWNEEWPMVEQDFDEMKALGANVVRIHLQVGKFMKTPTEPNQVSLDQLARLAAMAEKKGLYLDITGLCCYRRKDVPKWYDPISEADRWAVQARFWEAIAKTCANSSAIFCYNLMNEPVLSTSKQEWLAPKGLGNMVYVQRITLDLAGRTDKEVIKAWVDKLVGAIRKYDSRHMTTVGDIPWGLTFKGAKPLFYAKGAGDKLDYISVHLEPHTGEIDLALKVLSDYNLGKPIVMEEIFPLKCSIEELEEFIEASRSIGDGWVSFYWGKKSASNYNTWLTWFAKKAPEITGNNCKTQ